MSRAKLLGLMTRFLRHSYLPPGEKYALRHATGWWGSAYPPDSKLVPFQQGDTGECLLTVVFNKVGGVLYYSISREV